MSLLDKASLIVTPNAVKESKLYSVVPNTTLGDMDVVRATTATRVNSAGLIEVVPRNLLTYSNDLTKGIWTKTNTTITLNTIANPLNGLVNGQTFTPNTTNADHFAFGESGITVAGQPYIMSFFVKANGYTNCRLGNAATGAGIWFNLSNGTIISGTGGAITALSNGWYLVSYSLTSVGTSVNPLISFAPSTSTSFAGNGISGGYVFGAQLDQGSTATEYFPTTTRLNIPRIDYTNGSCPSLLVEPQRTNTLTYSNEFSNVAWTKIASATITFNSAIANPQGGGSFYLTASNLSFGGILRQLSTFVIGQTYTSSFFVKKGNYRYVGLRINGSVNGLRYPTYDFDTDTFDKQGVTCTVNRTLLTNGWIKLSLTYTANNADTSCDLALVPSNGDVQTALSGGQFVYVYGAQLELGAYATSYIPTVASSVTRNADVLFKTGISSLIGQTEGTIFFDGIVNNIQNSSSNILNTNKAANTISSIALTKIKATNKIRFEQFLGNGTFANISLLSTNSFADGVRTKVAIRYKSGDFAMYINGNLEATSTSTYTNIGVKSELFLNDSVTAFAFQESVSFNSVQLYKTPLTNSELQSLSTI